MDTRPITAEQVEEILARALELERLGPMIREDDLKAIAAEVSISPEALERATAEVLARPARDGAAPPDRSWIWEALGVAGGGVLAGAVAGAGFSILAVMIVLLGGVALASRRDWESIARLMAQWVALCGVFGSVASLMVAGISTGTLWTLFAVGGLLSMAIVALQERGSPEVEGSDPPRLPAS